MSRTLPLLGLVFFAASAWGSVPICKVDQLTNQCRDFDSSKEFIETSNGGKIPNLSYKDQEKWKQDPSSVSGGLGGEDQMLASLDTQIKIMEVLDKPTSALSEKFKVFLAGRSGILNTVLTSTNPAATVALYLPPDSEKGKITTSTVKDARELLARYYSSEQLKTLATTLQSGLVAESVSGPAALKVHPFYAKLPEQVGDERIKELVEFARKSLIKTIRAGRPDSALSEQELAAIKKVSTISFTPMNSPQLLGNQICSGIFPNAFYSPEDNSISICSSFKYFPEASLVSVIGHELAHSIDTCNAQFGVLTVNQARVSELLAADTSKLDPLVLKDLKNLKGKTQITSLSDNLMRATPGEINAKLEELGALTRVTKDFSFTTYPFQAVSSCLSSSLGGSFRSVASQREEALQEIESSTVLSPREIEILKRGYKSNPECLIANFQPSQMGEAMSDWFGAQVTADFLKQNQPTQKPNLDSTIFFSNVYCAGQNAENKGSIYESIVKVLGNHMDAHPMAKDRIENIFLRNPTIAQVSGCAAEAAECKNQSRTFAPFTGQHSEAIQ